MINQRTVESAVILDLHVADSGLDIDAVPNTPLAELVAVSSPPPIMHTYHDADGVAHNELERPHAASVVKEANSRNVFGGNDHGTVLDAVVNKAVNTLGNQLKVARNEAVPIIKNIVEKIEQGLSEAATPAQDYTIVVYELNPIMNMVPFRTILESTGSRQPQDLSGPELPDLDQVTLLRYVNTGISSINEKIDEMLTDNETLLKDAYDQIRAGDIHDSGSPDILYIVQFAILRSMVNDISSFDDPSVINTISQRLFIVRRTLMSRIMSYESSARNKRIILRRPSDAGQIIVHKGVYDKFLKEGGDVEAIIGSVIKDINAPTYGELLSDNFGGKLAVKQKALTTKALSHANNERLVNKLARRAIADEIRSEDVEESVKSAAVREAVEWQDKHKYRARDKVEVYVRQMVCSVLYPSLDIVSILEGIDSYMADDETCTPREAATMVTFDIVAKWLAGQITVGKHIRKPGVSEY